MESSMIMTLAIGPIPLLRGIREQPLNEARETGAKVPRTSSRKRAGGRKK
jgi:hypothetical protein